MGKEKRKIGRKEHNPHKGWEKEKEQKTRKPKNQPKNKSTPTAVEGKKKKIDGKLEIRIDGKVTKNYHLSFPHSAYLTAFI